MELEQKIIKLKKELAERSENYFKQYAGKKQDADYFLFVGKCNGVGEAIDLIDEIIG